MFSSPYLWSIALWYSIMCAKTIYDTFKVVHDIRFIFYVKQYSILLQSYSTGIVLALHTYSCSVLLKTLRSINNCVDGVDLDSITLRVFFLMFCRSNLQIVCSVRPRFVTFHALESQ